MRTQTERRRAREFYSSLYVKPLHPQRPLLWRRSMCKGWVSFLSPVVFSCNTADLQQEAVHERKVASSRLL